MKNVKFKEFFGTSWAIDNKTSIYVLMVIISIFGIINYNIFASGDNVGTVISMKNNDKKLEAFIEHNDKTHSNIIQRFDSFLLNHL